MKKVIIGIWSVTIAGFALIAAPPTVTADPADGRDAEMEELRRRVEALEAERREEPSGGTHWLLGALGDSTHLHGYGELHFNNPKEDALSHRGNAAQADLHRMVIGVAHEWTDRARLDVEVDYEHAATEMELEYAHVDLDITDFIAFRSGLLLMPVGYLNEFHEPTNFYSIQRPRYMKNIIPTTWQEAGFGLVGNGLMDGQTDFRLYLVNGLDAGDFRTSDGLRPGRGRGDHAPASDLALTGRFEFRPAGIEGLQVGAGFYYGGADQEDHNPTLHKNIDVGIWTADAHYRINDFEFRTEIVGVNVTNSDQLGSLTSPVGSRMEAFQFEGGYHLKNMVSPDANWHDLVAFVRHEQFDTNANVKGGATAAGSAEREVLTTGVAFYPIEQVAFKADVEMWEDNSSPDEDTVERFNLGVAWRF